MRWVWRLLVIIGGIMASTVPAAKAADTVTGTAIYRERIAVPPTAVFTAVLADVSRADAAAPELGRATIDPAGPPPYKFEIPYDSAAIDPNHTYAVRAKITVDDQLMFTTDTVHPVLTRGSPQHVEIVMKMASGRMPSPQTGNGTKSVRFQGMFTYLADAGRFRECHSGKSYPVAAEASFPELQEAYRENTAEPGAPLRVAVEGEVAMRPKMDGDGEEPTMIVHGVADTFPGKTCADDVAPAQLLNTYWVLEHIGDLTIEPAKNKKRQAHLVLTTEESRYRATAGCNLIGGQYTLDGDKLRLLPGPMTQMACAPPIDEYERRLLQALESTESWKIDGMNLTLIGRNGEDLAKFRAEYLR
jgi:uncharacterized lipoprotein YbaY/heat shock protein HslJ